MVSDRVNIPPVEMSNSVNLVGRACTTRLSRMTAANTAAVNTAAYAPLCRARALAVRFFRFGNFMLPPPQFQRRRSSVCPVRNRNSAVTER